MAARAGRGLAESISKFLVIAVLLGVAAAENETNAEWFRVLQFFRPSIRYGHSMVYASGNGRRGKAYLFGGRGLNNNLDDMWEYDVSENKWAGFYEVMENVPSPRSFHAVAAVLEEEQQMYVHGGGDDEDYFDDMHILNITKRSWSSVAPTGAIPSGRRQHTLVYDGSALYLFGGQVAVEHIPTGVSNELFKYSIATETWELLSSMGLGPLPRYGHTAVVVDVGEVWIFGGYGVTYLSDIYIHCYTAGDNLWEQLYSGGDVPPPRYGHIAYYGGDGAMYAFGGLTSDGLSNDVYRYVRQDGAWQLLAVVGEPPAARRHMAGYWDAAGMVFVGGLATGTFNDMYKLEVLDIVTTPEPGPDVGFWESGWGRTIMFAGAIVAASLVFFACDASGRKPAPRAATRPMVTEVEI